MLSKLQPEQRFNNLTELTTFLSDKLKIVNVVSTVNLLEPNEKLNLKEIYEQAAKQTKIQSQYRNSQLLLKTRTPIAAVARVTVNGILICTANKIEDSKTAAREFAKFIKKINTKQEQKISFKNFRIVNIVAAIDTMLNVNLRKIHAKNPYSKYDPDTVANLYFRVLEPKITIIISRKGNLVFLGAKKFLDIQTAFSKILPVLLINS